MPPSTRRPRPAAGSWSVGPPTSFFSPSVPPYAAAGPGRPGRGCVEAPSTTTSSRPPPSARLRRLPGGAPRFSRWRRRGCGPCSRTVVGEAWRPSVSPAGPADPASFLLANRLVGNGDGRRRAGDHRRDGTAALPRAVSTSPSSEARRTSASTAPPSRPARCCRCSRASCSRSARLRGGLRAYVAVAGGLLGPEVFGSLASDEAERARTRPARARGPGARAGPGRRRWVTTWRRGAAPRCDRRVAAGPFRVLRVVPGPHASGSRPTCSLDWRRCASRCDGRSNRIGIRLRLRDDRWRTVLAAAGAGAGAGTGLDSQGTVAGALQVPPGGEPVVLMPDHATLGGYPVVAVVRDGRPRVARSMRSRDRGEVPPRRHRRSRRRLATPPRRRLAHAVSRPLPAAVE